MRRAIPLILTVFSAARTGGQTFPPHPSFEVASIRPHQGPMHTIDISTSGSRLTAEAETVIGLVMYAFNLSNSRTVLVTPRGPSSAVFYDILAKAEGNGTPTTAQFREMMQALLAERFSLKFHREVKEMPVYALVVAKGGPKLKPSPSGTAPVSNHGVNGRNQNITLTQATMESLAQNLRNSFFVDRPVLDKTGLTGAYNIKLEATPEFRIGRGQEDPGELSVFTALKQQLGLRLEPQIAPIEIFVVDQFEKPTEN
jgi:uncharacterized protein (TIGR03435 family)